MKSKISMIGSLSFVEEENRSPKVVGKIVGFEKTTCTKEEKGLKVRPTYHIKQTKLSKRKQLNVIVIKWQEVNLLKKVRNSGYYG